MELVSLRELKATCCDGITLTTFQLPFQRLTMTTYYNRFLARYDTLPVIYTSSRLKWYITYLGVQRHGFDVGWLKKSKYQFKLCAFSTFASSKFAHAQHCSNYKMWNDNSADGQNEAQGTKKCIHCNIIQMFLTGCLCHDYHGIHVR